MIDKAFKVTVVNLALASLHGGSLETKVTVPLPGKNLIGLASMSIQIMNKYKNLFLLTYN